MNQSAHDLIPTALSLFLLFYSKIKMHPHFCLLRGAVPNYLPFSRRWKFDPPLVNAASRQQSVVNTEDGH